VGWWADHLEVFHCEKNERKEIRCFLLIGFFSENDVPGFSYLGLVGNGWGEWDDIVVNSHDRSFPHSLLSMVAFEREKCLVVFWVSFCLAVPFLIRAKARYTKKSTHSQI
jgi:hypothetical protein